MHSQEKFAAGSYLEDGWHNEFRGFQVKVNVNSHKDADGDDDSVVTDQGTNLREKNFKETKDFYFVLINLP